MRRRHGEDDTDRDIRVAREQERERQERKVKMIDGADVVSGAGAAGREARGGKAEQSDEVRLFDDKGHIALFTEPMRGKNGKGASTQDPRKRKRDVTTATCNTVAASRHDAKDSRQNHESGKGAGDNIEGTRLIDALTDRRGNAVVPWYNDRKVNDASGTLENNSERDDDDGDDYDRRQRLMKRAATAAKTTASNDPLAMMRRAQSQIKEAGRNKLLDRDREREMVREGDPYGKGYYYDRIRKERKREEKRAAKQTERERELSERHRHKHKHRLTEADYMNDKKREEERIGRKSRMK